VVLQEGVSIVNDISGLRYDPSLAEVVAAAGAALVLMHTRGRSSDMYREAVYEDVAVDVKRELEESIARAVAAGVFLGAHIVRVHDVPEMVDVVRVADKVRAVASGAERSVASGGQQ
jgi:dihydropteroate synthase